MSKKISLDDAIKIAESRGENAFPKNISIVNLECNKNHQWNCSFRSIKNRHSWCPYCANRKLSILVAQELAYVRNGKCISEKYVYSKAGWV